MDALYEVQKSLQKQIANSFENLKKKGVAKMTRVTAQTRLAGLEDWYAQFTSNHKKILVLKDVDLTHDYFAQNVYEQVIDSYFDRKGEFVQFLEDLRAVQIEESPTPEPPVGNSNLSLPIADFHSLPKMNLPKFSGNFSDWENFRDLFRSLVHRRTDLDASIKFYYLRTHLSGDGLERIKSIPIASDQYVKAWETLVNYYDNKRRAINNMLKKIFNVKPMKSENANELNRVYTEIISPIDSLKALGRSDSDLGNDLIVYLIVQQFDSNTQKDWKKSLDAKTDVPPTLEELKEFVESQLTTLESFDDNVESNNISKSKNAKGKQSKQGNEPTTAHVLQTTAKETPKHEFSGNNRKPIKCVLCNAEHTLAKCESFSRKSVPERRELVKTQRLCFNCLGPTHSKQQCKSRFSCFSCRSRHHTMLHEGNNPRESQSDTEVSTNVTKERSSTAPEPKVTTHAVVLASSHTTQAVGNSSGVLLATAQICVTGPKNRSTLVKALIDPCSQVSLITQALSNQLAIEFDDTHVCIKGVGENAINRSNKLAKFCISPHFASEPQFRVEALVLSKLSDYSPPRISNSGCFTHLQGLQLADPNYTKNSKIDLLLGANVYADIVENQVLRGAELQPIAISSRLGWLLMGRVPIISSDSLSNSTHRVSVLHCSCAENGGSDLHNLLQEFWRVEEVQVKNSCTIDEQECEKLYSNTTNRDQFGRYVVKLPWKNPNKLREYKIGESYPHAIQALKRLEMNFHKDSRLKEEYSRFMREYLDLGHMTLLEGEVPSTDSDCFFLPHHGVWKEASSSTKLRTVFNGSSRLRTGNSLNDMLLTGPNLLKSPIVLICRLRNFKIALSADVEKMFRQIGVDFEDRKYQSILWRFEPQEKVQVYLLNTVTYGLTCSPYLAIRTLLQMADDHKSDFPIAAEAVREDMYSDNVLTGAHNVSEAIDKVKELVQLFKRAQMNLRKWSASEPEALSTLPKDMLVMDEVNLFASDNSVSLLGISWHPKGDFFKFHLENVAIERLITKRSVLSRIARTFDPLGWIAPVVIQAKIIMQMLWLQKVSWDEPLPTEVASKWSNWVSELPLLGEIEIPRWSGFTPQTLLVEVHGFADASKLAYGAVLYLRLVQDSKVLVSLQVAKSKVAPVKTVSIPRLELCAALLLARLVHLFKSSSNFVNLDVHLWTDSADVLFWLRDHPSRWNVFVANRCSEIHTLMPDAFWHHVRSKDNPADLVSRGVEPSKLRSQEIWWKGPRFLTGVATPWSKRQDELNFTVHSLVINHVQAAFNVTVDSPRENSVWDIVEKFSSLTTLLRVTCYCLRFIARICQHSILRANRKNNLLGSNCFSSDEFRESTSISASELLNAKLFWFYLVQRAHFDNEYILLAANKRLSHKNPLANLNPHIQNQLIRVGGRLANSLTSDDSKYPVILPRSSTLTKLLIRQAHLRCLHGGTQLTLATLRQEVWIVRGRSEVRRIVRACVQCARYAAQTPSQLMSDLPSARVRPSYPFETAGVDYAGPVFIRLTKTRGKGTMKGYICVFVCMATKAVHLEIVEDYTADSFIAAFHRFTARRGHCRELRSDQGTNFVGADAQLQQMLQEFSRSYDLISHSLADLGTEWKFNPPSAPHFGGLWEAAVKSLKHHLKRVIGEQILTFSEMATLLCRIEACLNSRPLVALSDDPSDMRFLTPAHFLIQRESFLVPEANLTNENIPVGKRWQLLTQMAQQFWVKWSNEYLTTLQSRSKWLHVKPSPQLGDVVFVRNELSPPGKWPLGRIIALHPGNDGLVRVVSVQTSTGQLRRPLVKLVPLPKIEQLTN